MDVDDLVKILFFLLLLGGGFLSQLLQSRQKPAGRPQGPQGPPRPAGGEEDDIARRVREMMRRAAMERQAEKPRPEPVKPRPEPVSMEVQPGEVGALEREARLGPLADLPGPEVAPPPPLAGTEAGDSFGGGLGPGLRGALAPAAAAQAAVVHPFLRLLRQEPRLAVLALEVLGAPPGLRAGGPGRTP